MSDKLFIRAPGTIEDREASPGGFLRQMDPGELDVRCYTLTEVLYFREASRLIAHVLVPKVGGTWGDGYYQAGKEYWFDVSPTAPARRLIVTWQDYRWGHPSRDIPVPALGTQSFVMEQAAVWATQAVGMMPGVDPLTFVSNATDIAIRWNLSHAASTVSTVSPWSGHLLWFNRTGQNDIFGGGMASGVTLTALTQCNTTKEFSWCAANVPPQ